MYTYLENSHLVVQPREPIGLFDQPLVVILAWTYLGGERCAQQRRRMAELGAKPMNRAQF